MEQTIINWVFAGAGAAFGWVLKVVWDAIQDLKKDIRQIERDLPEVYVRRTHGGRLLEVRSRYKADGGLVRTFADVTDYVEAQRALRDSERELRALLTVLRRGRHAGVEARRGLNGAATRTPSRPDAAGARVV